MAETTVTNSKSVTHRLFDGDFIDLTEDVAKTQPKENPPDKLKKQLMTSKSATVTEAASRSIVNPTKNVQNRSTTVVKQQLLVPISLATTSTGGLVLAHHSGNRVSENIPLNIVSTSTNKKVGQPVGGLVLSQLSGNNKPASAKIAKNIVSTSGKKKGGQPVGGMMLPQLSGNNIQQPVSEKIAKNIVSTAAKKKVGHPSIIKSVLIRPPNTITEQFAGLKDNNGNKNTIEKVTQKKCSGVKLNPVTMKSTIAQQSPNLGLLGSSSAKDINIQQIFLRPTSSETVQRNVRNDDIMLLPTQSETNSVVKDSSILAETLSTLMKSTQQNRRKQTFQLIDNNNDDDDVIFISGDETKKPALSLPVNILKQRYAACASDDKVTRQAVFIQANNEGGGYVFLGLQQGGCNETAKAKIVLEDPSQTISTSFFKKNQLVYNQENANAEKDKATIDQTDPTEEIFHDELLSMGVKTGPNFKIIGDAIGNGKDVPPVYFVMYPPDSDKTDHSTNEDCTIISDDDEPAIIEPELERQESDVEDVTLEPPLVTPVDITKILNEAQKTRTRDLPDRCCSVKLKKMNLYRKGFTKREMRRPSCLKVMKAIINKNHEKIRELKKSALRESSFVHCGSNFINNFLPETSKCEDDDEEYTIEYNNIEKQLSDEIFNSPTLPIITNVISKVNEEVATIRTQNTSSKKKEEPEDLQKMLAKPEAALKLIKRGLELIKSWSKENHTAKARANKSLPAAVTTRSAAAVAQVQRKTRHSAPVPVVAEPAKKTGRVRKRDTTQKKETAKERPVASPQRKARGVSNSLKTDVKVVRKRKTGAVAETASPTKKRIRKKKNAGFNDDDDELFIIKKVDILNGRRK